MLSQYLHIHLHVYLYISTHISAHHMYIYMCMLPHALSKQGGGGGGCTFALYQNMKHCLLPKQITKYGHSTHLSYPAFAQLCHVVAVFGSCLSGVPSLPPPTTYLFYPVPYLPWPLPLLPWSHPNLLWPLPHLPCPIISWSLSFIHVPWPHPSC